MFDGSIGSVMKMMCLFWRTTVVGLAVMPLLASIPVAAAQTVRPTSSLPEIQAVKAAKPPVIDGVVDEGEWQGAVTATNFIQYEPRRGEQSGSRTEALVLYDAGHLYVAFRAWDSEPITAQLTQRDADLFRDDAVVVVIDTTNDRRSGYYFITNALGTQADGRIADDGRTTEPIWDAPWESAARRTDDGWSAEFSIPLSSVRYAAGYRQTWGINFGRSRRRTLETSFWSGPLDNQWRVSEAGHLTSLSVPPPIDRIQVVPYGLSRLQDRVAPEWNAGIDARYALTPTTAAYGTLYPDFATIEADQEQINLTGMERCNRRSSAVGRGCLFPNSNRHAGGWRMRNRTFVVVAALFLASLVSQGLQSQTANPSLPAVPLPPPQATAVPGLQATYVGSIQCRRCHAQIYARWSKTRMANVVTDPKIHPEVIRPDFSKPNPLVTFTRNDIALVYGSKWKQRYFSKVGDDYFPFPAQWDIQNSVWRAYMVAPNTDWWVPFYPPDNMKRPTGPLCDGCHSVNYNIRTKTVAEWNVGCERCHGPGSEHIQQPGPGNIVNPAHLDYVRATDTCLQCHSQGRPLTDPIEGQHYDWPVGFHQGLELKNFWQLEEH